MSPQLVLILSTYGSMVVGASLVPWIVAFVVREHWRNQIKRGIALGVSALIGALQWYLTLFITGKAHWEGMAITIPVIFGMATLAYTQYWKPYTGAVTQLDILGKLLGGTPPAPLNNKA